jgi:DHA1 family bicyclomycin/chloramphenicol resistance-like MFS transporter
MLAPQTRPSGGPAPGAQAADGGTARGRLRLILTLGALTAFAPLSIDMYLPALPALSVSFQTGASEVQLTLSAFFLGLALGQATVGPLSDALGRRRPLLVGLAVYTLASLLCAAAPTVAALVAFRFVQGFAGAAGIVIARAIVRDLHTGVAAAQFLSVLMLVSGLAPILAPVIGGQLLLLGPWQVVFLVLAVFSGLLLVVVMTGLRETLPPEQRQTDGLRGTLVTFRDLLRDRAFLGYALACGLAIAAVFCYISGASFVFQDIYGASPQTFSVIFGLNAVGLVAAGQVNGRLVRRVEPLRLLTAGLVTSTLGGLVLLAVVASGLGQSLGLAGFLVPLFVVVAPIGFIMPNATVLALAGAPRIAGSASALLGLLQFGLGALVAPLVGLGGGGTALPMALAMAVLELAALLALLVLGRGLGLTALGRLVRHRAAAASEPQPSSLH